MAGRRDAASSATIEKVEANARTPHAEGAVAEAMAARSRLESSTRSSSESSARADSRRAARGSIDDDEVCVSGETRENKAVWKGGPWGRGQRTCEPYVRRSGVLDVEIKPLAVKACLLCPRNHENNMENKTSVPE